jgi:hypothetical protein
MEKGRPLWGGLFLLGWWGETPPYNHSMIFDTPFLARLGIITR